MLEVSKIRENKEDVIKGLTKRNFKEIELIEKVLEADERRRTLKTQSDQLQAAVNKASKSIGQLMREGKKEEADQQKREVGELKTDLLPLQEELQVVSKILNGYLERIPNVPHSSVPEGTSSEQNEIIKQSENLHLLPKSIKPHWELAKEFDLIDFNLGNKITGSGFPVYKGQGARLQWALMNYFLQYNMNNGYVPYQPPLLVNEDSGFGTGQLPDKEGQMYYIQEDGFYCIPTAEVPLTNIYRGEILKEDQLPVKMTAYSPCFRREAGSYGKEVRGLNRLHQFDKVEIVRLVDPAGSYDDLNEMVSEVEKLVQSLNLPYRILRLCGGDLSFTAALTYDFEVYSAAQKRWLEVSSVSNFETFQTNRMKIRAKMEGGKKQLLHSLNGSSLALPRIVASLLENNQDGDCIHLPEVLHPFFGKKAITK